MKKIISNINVNTNSFKTNYQKAVYFSLILYLIAI